MIIIILPSLEDIIQYLLKFDTIIKVSRKYFSNSYSVILMYLNKYYSAECPRSNNTRIYNNNKLNPEFQANLQFPIPLNLQLLHLGS